MNDSFLQKLRELSVERCEKHYFKLDHWNVLEWAGAAAGECGEMANIAKKMREAPGVLLYHVQLADEVADTIIYLDLLCASQGIDLEIAIKNKFNERSANLGYDRKLQ